MNQSQIHFDWNGSPVAAMPGDTVASALYRSGLRTFTHSYQYGRPRGLLCLTGSCPNCMVNVDGVPNVRSCTLPARSGLSVLSQNQNVYRGVESPLVRPFLPAPPLTEAKQQYEHTYQHFDVVVIGGGPSGLEAARAAAAHGALVAVLERQPALSGDVEIDQAIEIFLNCSCFGLYEGNLVGAVQIDYGKSHAETLLHLRAGSIVVATGAYETQFLFAGNDLPGVMLSTAVLRLIERHAIAPGKQAVLIGDASRCSQPELKLRAAGIEVVASVPIDSVVSATGHDHVSALVTATATYDADLVVMCGPLVPDLGLVAQSGSRLQWNQEKSAFLAHELPASITVVGAAAAETSVGPAYLPPPSAQSASAIACLCMDVTGHDVVQTIDAGMSHIELIKRLTKLGKSACQGRMCQMAAVHLCSQVTGQSIADVGTTVSRPPAPPVTLGALAGMRHHPVRRTPMHEQHDQLGAVWMDLGDWKRPRYYDPSGLAPQDACVEQEYRAVRERAGVIDVSTLGKLEV